MLALRMWGPNHAWPTSHTSDESRFLLAFDDGRLPHWVGHDDLARFIELYPGVSVRGVVRMAQSSGLHSPFGLRNGALYGVQIWWPHAVSASRNINSLLGLYNGS